MFNSQQTSVCISEVDKNSLYSKASAFRYSVQPHHTGTAEKAHENLMQYLSNVNLDPLLAFVGFSHIQKHYEKWLMKHDMILLHTTNPTETQPSFCDHMWSCLIIFNIR